MASLEEVAESLANAPRGPDLARAVQSKLTLLAANGQAPTAFLDLPRQAVHGDFQSTNVLWTHGSHELAAVVDWETLGRGARVDELLRAISYSGVLEPPLLDAYLRGYRRHVSLTPDECELGVEMWWQHQLHSTWFYREAVLANNLRVMRFQSHAAALLQSFANPGFREEIGATLRRLAT